MRSYNAQQWAFKELLGVFSSHSLTYSGTRRVCANQCLCFPATEPCGLINSHVSVQRLIHKPVAICSSCGLRWSILQIQQSGVCVCVCVSAPSAGEGCWWDCVLSSRPCCMLYLTCYTESSACLWRADASTTPALKPWEEMPCPAALTSVLVVHCLLRLMLTASLDERSHTHTPERLSQAIATV